MRRCKVPKYRVVTMNNRVLAHVLPENASDAYKEAVKIARQNQQNVSVVNNWNGEIVFGSIQFVAKHQMSNAKKVRALRKLFRKVAENNDYGHEMAMIMGGGECSAEICDYFQSSMRETVLAACAQIGMTGT